MLRRVIALVLCAPLAVWYCGVSRAEDEGPLLPGISSESSTNEEPAAPPAFEPSRKEEPSTPSEPPRTAPSLPEIAPGAKAQADRAPAFDPPPRGTPRRWQFGTGEPDEASESAPRTPPGTDRLQSKAKPKWSLPARTPPTTASPQPRPPIPSPYWQRPAVVPPRANPSQVRSAPSRSRSPQDAARSQAGTVDRWNQPYVRPTPRTMTGQRQPAVPQTKAAAPWYRKAPQGQAAPGRNSRFVPQPTDGPLPRTTAPRRPWPQTTRRPRVPAEDTPRHPWDASIRPY